MENELMKFVNEEFGEIRGIEINGEPYLVGKDVATVLGYAKPLNALATHVDEDDTLKQGIIDSLGRNQQTLIINESGLYSLIFGSKLPSAKRFKKWATSEVLPSIRRHGVYATPKKLVEMLEDPESVADLLTALKNEQDEKKLLKIEKDRLEDEKKLLEEVREQLTEELDKTKTEIAEILPIKEQYNDFLEAHGTNTMKDTAKILHTGRNQLMDFLRHMKVFNQDNSPASSYTKRQMFTVQCYVVRTKNNQKFTVAVSRTTSKGLDYLYKFLRKHIDVYILYDEGFQKRIEKEAQAHA